MGSVSSAFERDRLGNTLILAGAVVVAAAAGWSRYRGDPAWATVMVATPAVVVAGLTLAAGESLLPHIAELAAAPVGLAGIVGGVAAGSRRRRS